VAIAFDLNSIDQTISKSVQNAFQSLQTNVWNYPPYLGTLFLSEYYLEIKALNLTKSQFDEKYFTQLLLNSQLEDGSWV
jgi:hypothetical protein